MIRTDHYSLKYLLQQQLTTSPQQHWMSKLLGFDFEVEYKPGKLNKAADALSRRNTEQATLMAVTMVQGQLLEDLRRDYHHSSEGQAVYAKAVQGAHPNWTIHDGLVYYKSKIYVRPGSDYIPIILAAVHNTTHE